MTDIVDRALARIRAGALAGECEGLELDFKEDTGSRSQVETSIVKSAICLANATGGKIVVGVCDKGSGPSAITGTDMDAEQLRQRLLELCRPPLLVNAEVRDHLKRLIVLHISAGSTVYADSGGRSWHRVKTSCFPLSPSDQARLAQERSGFDWSAQPSDRPLTDVQPASLDAARDLLRRLQDERRDLARLSDVDLLRSLGLVYAGDELNRAGDILLCAARHDTPLIVYQYKMTPGGEPRAIHRLPQPLVTAFLRLMDAATARQSTTPVAIPSGQQITIEDFPTIAIREAFSNAICHREWQLAGPVIVDHSPEVFSVTSPGPLVSGVTPENILTMPSRPRNRTLASAVRLLGLAEETGRGVDRMFRETIRSGRQPPTFEAHLDRVRVSFVGGAPDTNIARFVARLSENEREDTDTMILLYHLCRFQTVTAEKAAPLLQKPIIETDAVLRRLSVEPVLLLERNRYSRGRSKAVYRLREDTVRGLGLAVLYNRRTLDELDRKIVEHIHEYGKITNRTLQNMFDVHVFRARDIIASLQQRGVLVKVSDTSRGSKVEWGAGPKFPRGKTRSRSVANKPPEDEQIASPDNNLDRRQEELSFSREKQ